MNQGTQATITSREQLVQKSADWASITRDDEKHILNTCGCVATIAGQGRDPFPFVTETGCAESDDGNWLLASSNWQIGDNVEFPSKLIRIRAANRNMADFIINHFDTRPALTIVPTITSATTGAAPILLQTGTPAFNAPAPSVSGPSASGAVPSSDIDEDSEDDDDEEIVSGSIKFGINKLQKLQASAIPRTLETRSPIHVGGTPGTGKTAFALYLLYTLLCKYPDDAYVYRHGDVNPGCFIYYKKMSYYHPSIVQVFSDGLLLKLLTHNFTRHVWTILDGAASIPTGTPVARIVVLTSPGQQTIPLKHLLKHATTIVNPPWEFREIQMLHLAAYKDLTTEDSVKTAYTKWGGIPRIIFDYANKPEKLSELEASIFISDTEALFRQAGLAQIDHANVSGLHFHLVPGQKVAETINASAIDMTFRYPSYCWASTWLQNRFWEVMKNEQGELKIMNYLLDRNHVSTARAFAFEPHVFRTVENSGFTGRVRLLTDTGHEQKAPKTLGPLERITFSELDKLPNDEGAHIGRFYVPVQTNHMSIDFYVPEFGLLIQVTVGQKHGVKWTGLDKAVKSGIFDEWINANPDEKLRILFLCDRFNFDEFSAQPYLTKSGQVVKSQTILTKMDMFVQYAYELDVEMQKRIHLDKKPSTRFKSAEDWSTPVVDDKGKGKGKRPAVYLSTLGSGPAADPTTSGSSRSGLRSGSSYNLGSLGIGTSSGTGGNAPSTPGGSEHGTKRSFDEVD